MAAPIKGTKGNDNGAPLPIIDGTSGNDKLDEPAGFFYGPRGVGSLGQARR